MPAETIQQIIEEAARRVAPALEPSGPDAEAVQKGREGVQALEGIIGAAAVREALRGMEGADKALREQKLRELGDRLTAAFRPLGLQVECRVFRRKPKAKKPAKPAAPQKAEQASAMGEGTTELRVAQ